MGTWCFTATTPGTFCRTAVVFPSIQLIFNLSECRLGRGDMVNGVYGKFCVENDAFKMTQGEFQRITFTAVRDMDMAKVLVSEMVKPLEDNSLSRTPGELWTGKENKPKGFVIVHMVVASCRMQHYISFSNGINQLARSITTLRLWHIFSMVNMMEAPPSMLFLKVNDWEALLEWMESGDALGERLDAYRQACALAQERQAYYLQNMRESMKDLDRPAEKETKCIAQAMDAHSHMVMRITMNGFVQMHLMWNEEKQKQAGRGRKRASKSSAESLCADKVSAKNENPKDANIVHGIFWCKEVEVMVKMRMGLVLQAIEILC